VHQGSSLEKKSSYSSKKKLRWKRVDEGGEARKKLIPSSNTKAFIPMRGGEIHPYLQNLERERLEKGTSPVRTRKGLSLEVLIKEKTRGKCQRRAQTLAEGGGVRRKREKERVQRNVQSAHRPIEAFLLER